MEVTTLPWFPGKPPEEAAEGPPVQVTVEVTVAVPSVHEPAAPVPW